MTRPELPAPPSPGERQGELYGAISRVLAAPSSPHGVLDQLLGVLSAALGVPCAVLGVHQGFSRLRVVRGPTAMGGLVGLEWAALAAVADGTVVEVGVDAASFWVLALGERLFLAGAAEGVDPAGLALVERLAPAVRIAAASFMADHERRRADRLRRALRIGERVSDQSREDRLRLLGRAGASVLGASQVVVSEVAGRSLVVRAAAGTGDFGLLEELDVGAGVAGWVLRNQLSVLVGSAEAGVGVPSEAVRAIRGVVSAESALVVPLVGADGPVGVLAALDAVPYRFDVGDVLALERLARLVALWDVRDRGRLLGAHLGAEEHLPLANSLGMSIVLETEQRRIEIATAAARDPEWVIDLGLDRCLVVAGSAAVRRAATDALRESADRDPLTGVWHRQAFLARASERLEAEGPRSGAYVLLIDLDQLWDVNEREGIAAGDRYLVRAVTGVLEALGPEAVVGRIGGDEFAALIVGTTSSRDFGTIRRDMLEVLGARGVAVSLGAASIQDGDVLAAVQRAERDLVADLERRGVARVERVTAPLEPADIALAPELVRALEGDREAGTFGVVFQPVVELATGQIAGVEALARWEHPRLGTVLPGRFLPIAVHLRLVERVDELVRALALRQVVELERTGVARGLRVSFNLSAESARRRGIASRLIELVERSGIAANQVVVELTESEIAASALEQLRRTLEALAGAGIKVALDDFGVGTSSFRHLATLAVHEVKIDRSFVANVGTKNGSSMLDGLVSLARRLGVELVAEGVQDASTAARLLELGVPKAQGFYFFRPLSPGGLARVLRQRRRALR
ncbi:diguanylate cyclase/phosphodiesterase [Acidimicrobium ferrooxidans DSM 10331]|uniref:Diguanylate cyclase/phosphodiesterase n=1 Tax=Acidimicrobium ferrooxidans (strain DSM 10331 / JCM 15462 / NBRC 103882 / ICP) TaxID=525909 RepID=C7M084_ACIFD|nr:diguanylate cyclase/phosphodiesterase [Acidimicrobium ferrooxidans DSM 10331]